MIEDKDYIVYVRGNGFLTESGGWSDDIVDAQLFIKEDALNRREKIIKASDRKYNPVILKWC